MFLNGNTFQKSSCRYVQQPYWDGVVLPVILFKLQFLHLHLAMLVWYISVQKKKKKTNSTKTPCRSKAQSLMHKRKTCSVSMCVTFVVNYTCTVNARFLQV